MSPPTGEDDAQIIASSRDRPARFALIFDRHSAQLHRYLARRVGLQPADDLLAETFLIAFGKRAGFDLRRTDARPWLYGIAANLLAEHRRGEQRRSRLQLAVPVEREPLCHADLVADRVSAQASRPGLQAAIAALADGDREVLLLIAWEELSYAEVSQALDIPIGTVRSRLHRARRKVRAALGGSDPSALLDAEPEPEPDDLYEVVHHG